jgi:hypothetical protein
VSARLREGGEGTLSVVIRTADGDTQVLNSPFDPSQEIYVAYVVSNGRLWIRRVFDESTPPGQDMVIDPRFTDVDWSADEKSHGKAAYRALGEGHWVVDVTGDGSLGLARQKPGELARRFARWCVSWARSLVRGKFEETSSWRWRLIILFLLRSRGLSRAPSAPRTRLGSPRFPCLLGAAPPGSMPAAPAVLVA